MLLEIQQFQFSITLSSFNRDGVGKNSKSAP